MELYRAADCPLPRRATYWNDVYASRFAHVSFRPADNDFDAELRLGELGALGIAEIRTSGTEIERTPLHIAQSKERIFSFILMVHGAAEFCHYGNEATLRPGDFTLCDNAAPHRVRLSPDSRFLVLRTTPATLRNHLPCPEQLCGLRLAADLGMTPTAAEMTRSIWRQLERGIPDGYGDRIAGQLLEMLSTAYATGLGHRMTNSTVVGMRKAQARQYVESRLQDPTISASTIAAGLRISPRYLRLLFAEDDESVSTYILRRRLEECASHIAGEGWRNLTITEIAFKWGFNSSAYFARAFRQRYGMTATEFRRMKTMAH